MDNKLWAENIKKNIEVFADMELQRKGWIEGDISSNTISWYDEICDLFDSNLFDDFLDQNKELLNAETYSLLKYLKDRLDKYEGHEDDAIILADPQWVEISNLAKKVIKVWNL